MFRVQIYIKSQSQFVIFDANLNGLTWTKRKENVRNLTEVSGSLKIGGNGRGDEYDLIKTSIELVKLPSKLEQYDGTTWNEIAKFYTITDSNWDDGRKIVELTVEPYNEYTRYEEHLDYQYTAKQQGLYAAPLQSNPYFWNWGTKFQTKYSFSPLKSDDLGNVQSNANLNDGAYTQLFNGNKDKINYSEQWSGMIWGNSISGSNFPLLLFSFKDPKAITEIRLYADSRWDLKIGQVQLFDSTGALIDVFATSALPEDPSQVPHETIITMSTKYDVSSIRVDYAELTAADDWYYPLEFEFYSNQSKIDETELSVKDDYNLYIGAKPLRDVIGEIFGSTNFFLGENYVELDSVFDQSDYQHDQQPLQLGLRGTELENALVIPSDAIIGEADGIDYTSKDVFDLLNNIFHKYYKVTPSIVNSGLEYYVRNGQTELVDVKDFYYNTPDIDLTNYKGRDWSANLNSYNVNYATKQNLRYNSTSENSDFRTTLVNSYKANRVGAGALDVQFGGFEFDINDLLNRPSKYGNQLMLAKCNASILSSHYTTASNVDSNPDLLLNGNPWTFTNLTSFTLTNNSSSELLVQTDLLTSSQYDILRITNDIQDTQIKVLVSGDDGSTRSSINLIGADGIFETVLNFNVAVAGGDSYIVFLSVPPGTHEVSNFRIEKIKYTVDEGLGLNNGFALRNLLDKYIAEMPFSEMRYDTDTVYFDTHKAPDKLISPVAFPMNNYNDFNFDLAKLTGQGNIIPSKIERSLTGGNLITFDGYIEENASVTLGYGMLYNGFVAENANLMPTDWSVPTETDIETLETYLGGNFVAGGKLKESGTDHWDLPNTGADNSSGFTAFGSGRRSTFGVFSLLKDSYLMWTKTVQTPITNQYYLYLNKDTAESTTSVTFPQKSGLSIRAIYTGVGTPNNTIADIDGNIYDVIQIGTQYWTVQNWKSTRLDDGTSIPEVTDGTAWGNLSTMGRCYYNNDENNV